MGILASLTIVSIIWLETNANMSSADESDRIIIVDNKRIFPRYSLVYLLPFFVHYLPSFYILFCFHFVSLFFIYIGVSIPCNSFIQ